MKVLTLVGVLVSAYLYYLNLTTDMVLQSLGGLQQTYSQAGAYADGLAAGQ